MAFPGFGQSNFSFTFSNILFFPPLSLSASLELKHALQSLREPFAVVLFLAVFYWAQLEATSDPVE